MVVAALVFRARRAGLVVQLEGEQVVIEGPVGLSALAQALRARASEIRVLLEHEHSRPASASGFGPGTPESGGSAGTGGAAPDHSFPTSAHEPPPRDSGPWPREIVSLRVEEDGRIVSGPLCDANGREVAP